MDVLDRLLHAGARVMCVTVGAMLVFVLWRALPTVLWPETLTWVRAGGWIAVALGGVAGLLLARAGWPPGRLLLAPSARSFATLAFVLALGSGIGMHFGFMRGVPDVPDEVSYLHQARGFADGSVAPPSPPLAEFHYVSWGTHDRGRWYSVFPPGYGVLLAAGVELGVPWLVNPLLGALLALVLFALGRELFGGDGIGARAAVLIYLLSWFRLMHAGSFMSHPTAALLTGVVVLGAWRGVLVGGSPAWAAAAGAALGGLLATRPLNAIILVVVLLPALLHAVVRAGRAPLSRLVPGLVALAPMVIAYGAYNRALTGSPTLTPQERYIALKEERGDCFRLGFGPGVGQCPITQNSHFGKDGYQPRDAWVNTRKRLDAYVGYSFGFAPLALLLPLGLAGGIFFAPRRRALLGWMLLATAGTYALFFYHGVTYGARFYYETLPFAALLAAAAIVDGARLLRDRPRARAALAGVWLALLGSGMAAAGPAVGKHIGGRGNTRGGKWIAPLRAPELADAVVFVDSMVLPAVMTPHPARLDENHPLVVKDLGDAANAGYMRRWPERRPYRLRLGNDPRVEPLTYRRDAPVRHEGGALYPLEIAAGGFGDRVGADRVWNLPLSAGEALRFRAREAGARFAFPMWVPDEGATLLRLAVVLNPEGCAVDVFLDGAPLGGPLATREPTPRLQIFDLPAAIAPGRHWLEVRTRDTGTFLLDFAESRRAGTASGSP